mmetsp:Transcript_4178/g.6519  ORF Transcript_4178/g.6519 Transcript_4178/m.6519 type:complete len:95 (+) Transcript_4178:156-440(+)|eukprot:CAMPEP_0178896914 /NCGR_PEP_ID=MMETSP0786-20121207/1451_1 /TAXON_ID=186022 /ORGANISM="Thalassionema frauenfeldii, Strain CCMP 1798" /LENGTH=94 /DNA_ID=CAMNT_0020567397 /DNA_START=95 /DNA_END=379 /DNA_ORIENTATION=+
MADIDIMKRVEALEQGAKYDATKIEVDRVQMECLDQLRNIRKAMVESSGAAASSKEMEALREENAALKKQALKQEYRIEHLVSTVEKLLEERKD